MDQWAATVLVAIITGVFSIVTIIVQKKQDKTIKRIDEQSKIAQKEKELKESVNEKRRQLGIIANDMMILVLNTNLMIIESADIDDNIRREVNDMRRKSQDLFDKYDKLREELDDIIKTRDVVENLNDNLNSRK